MSSGHTEDLFRRGEFLRLIETATPEADANPKGGDAATRLRLAEALALTGNVSRAIEIASPYSGGRREPAVRAHAEYILAIAAWRSGNVTSAAKLFGLAVRDALESKNTRCVAWTYLHTFRFYVDFHPSDAVSSMLSLVRKAVIAAGDRQATAYLHSCVSALEGQKGRMSEAWRHCVMAESLLEDDPNAWILGAILLNKGCLHLLKCEIKPAETQLIAARDAYVHSGNLGSIATGSLGYLQLQTGKLAEARRTLGSIIDDPTLAETRKPPLRETLARVHLASNELAECAIQLSTLLDKNDDDIPGYISRWAEITNARMLTRRGQTAVALKRLIEAERRNTPGDSHFAAALNLTMSQLLMGTGQRGEATRRLLLCDEAGITTQNDLQAQYLLRVFCNGRRTGRRRQLRTRAFRLWATQGVITPRLGSVMEPKRLTKHVTSLRWLLRASRQFRRPAQASRALSRRASIWPISHSSWRTKLSRRCGQSAARLMRA